MKSVTSRVVSINPGVIETNIHTVTRSKIVLLGNSRFANAYRKYLDNVPNGLPPSAVAGTIVDAIASANPKLRYIIGARREKAGVRLRPYIPNKLFFPGSKVIDVSNFNGPPVP